MLERLKRSLLEAPIYKRGDYNYFIHPITDGVPEVRPDLIREVVTHIIRTANLDVDKIVTIEALKDEDWLVRSSAARALGEIGDARAVAPLIGALKDEYARVRSSAARALGEIGDARAVAPLTEALKDESVMYMASSGTYETVREAAAEALEKIQAE